MEVARGDVVLCVAKGDYGKPRPAVVVQSDLFNSTHASVSLCPITSEIIAAPMFRLTLSPSNHNGLERRSQVMVDKIISLPRERIRRVLGRLSEKQMHDVDAALGLWLGLSQS
jgi:mRNA interferase MazF